MENYLSKGNFSPFDVSVFLNEVLPSTILSDLKKVGVGVKSVTIHSLFSSKNPKVGLLIHEAISRFLCDLEDIKYPYEEHKFLYPKGDGVNVAEWGNGYGVISPHSDDLYETIDTDLLSLTVSKDETKSSTIIYDIDQVLNNFPADYLTDLLNMEFNYISGKNVNGRVITKKRTFREYKNNMSYYNIDLRKEAELGNRMYPVDKGNNYLVDELRIALEKTAPLYSKGKTGTFIVISNREVLHGRGQLPKEDNTERLLFRSKGSKYLTPQVEKELTLENQY
ncbi:carbon starvation induced protein CsiD [Flammeovirga pectinis]|nr:carbon starvation induced protein CsiD [Flammeovirga pectinis]